MIPKTSVLIISNYDHGVLPVASVTNSIYQLERMFFTGNNIGITRMFIVVAKGLYKAYGRKQAFSCCCYKICFIFQVIFPSWGTISIILEIRKRLMMILKSRIRTAGNGVVPASA